jgi:hypothetical protein
MHGHLPILKMREFGQQPLWVFINDYPCKTDWEQWGDHATVCVDGDNIKTLDLRFLVGCKVSISSESEKRARDLFNACKPYCETVAAGVTLFDDWKRTYSGWDEIWHR